MSQRSRGFEAKYFASEDVMIREFEASLREFDEKGDVRCRDVHVYCVGTPKTGTHSVASIFKKYRSEHEPLPLFMIELLRRVQDGRVSKDQLVKILRSKDRTTNLELESSHFNSKFSSELSRLFPKAKFIFLIRDVFSWLDSWLNHQLNHPNLTPDSAKAIGRNLYYRRAHKHTSHDTILRDLGLEPLSSYLEFWAEFNAETAIELPTERTLRIETRLLSSSITDIAQFVGIPPSRLCSERAHEYAATKKHNLLAQMDQSYLLESAASLCSATSGALLGRTAFDDDLKRAISSS